LRGAEPQETKRARANRRAWKNQGTECGDALVVIKRSRSESARGGGDPLGVAFPNRKNLPLKSERGKEIQTEGSQLRENQAKKFDETKKKCRSRSSAERNGKLD